VLTATLPTGLFVRFLALHCLMHFFAMNRNIFGRLDTDSDPIAPNL